MRKIFSTALIGIFSFVGVSSCAAKTSQQTNEENNIEKTNIKTEGKKLVVYSLSDYGKGEIS